MLNWLSENYQWLFGGAGVALFAGLIHLVVQRRRVGEDSPHIPIVINNNPTATVVNKLPLAGSGKVNGASPVARDREDVKATTRILFVDDDTRFKVVKILKNSGWIQTSLIKDLGSLDDPSVVSADIVFVDIQGVGIGLGFRDEGLGLAGALKERYPGKRVVIYSAEPRGEMFHNALKKADASLNKNADPYEFERLIEGFMGLE